MKLLSSSSRQRRDSITFLLVVLLVVIANHNTKAMMQPHVVSPKSSSACPARGAHSFNTPFSLCFCDENHMMIEYTDFLPNPNPSFSGPDVVSACMDTLLESRDAGLEVCFHFSSDRCRAAQGGSLETFRVYAKNPTFGFLVNSKSWKTESIGPVIQGTQHRGSMQTVLMSAAAEKQGEARQFLWTLQQERRPPLEGCWMVHEVLYVNNAFQQTV